MSNVITTDENDVLFEVKQKKCAIITLNRSRKLNSLNASMLSKLINIHQQQSQASWTNLIIHKSNISKSFCAGGDVVSVVQMVNINHFEAPIYMFQQEYSMNYMLGRLKKPVVALIDGITMGGGCGLSVHCPFRVATEKTKLAMPEMAIGYFPDVGASFFFTRLYGYLGWYLCLTGDVLQGVDNLIAGTATHYISSEKMPLVEQKLIELSLSNQDKHYDFEDQSSIDEWYFKINDLLDDLSEEINVDHAFKYNNYELRMIKEMFSENETIEQVIGYLESKASEKSSSNDIEKEFARLTLQKFHNQSLLSLKIAFELFKFSSKNTNFESLQMELNVAKNIIMYNKKTDLVEGVTTKLITKTNKPNWKFSSINEISDEYVQNFIKKNHNFGDIQPFNYNYGLFEKESMNYRMNLFTLPDFLKVKNSGFSKQNLLSKYRQYRTKKNLEYIIGFHRNFCSGYPSTTLKL